MAGRPAGLAGPFVGRARELAAVAGLIADDDRTGVVLIGGEAGLGKTRLVDEILAAHPSIDVVRGGAVPRAAPARLELIHTTVQPIIQTWPERPDPSVPVAEQVGAAAEVLRSLHHDRTIFVFDDVHWADPESLEVIDRLMAAGPLHATIVVTYRSESLRRGHTVNHFLERAERRAHALQIRLEPLRRDEVREYLAATSPDVGEQTVDRVHARTGGNPLFLSELVGAARDDRDLTETIPWTLAEILRPEIERLTSDVRVVAEAVSVLGADAEFDLVAAAVGASEDELLDRLRHLVDQGILVESRPDRFDFRHELVREAVADGLFARERRRIHAAAYDALVAAGRTDATALVAHATGAGRTAEAADIARRAALGAFEQGSSHEAFGFAEQTLLTGGDDVDMLRIAVATGWMTERYDAALDHLDRWDELTRTDVTRRAEVLHWRVRLMWETGDQPAAEIAAGDLAELAATLTDDAVRAQALADLAQHRMLSGQPTEAIAAADEALELATRSDLPAIVLQARAERASAQLSFQDLRADGVRELAAVADDAHDAGEWMTASRALNNLPIAAAPDPRRHLERMRSAAQRSGLTCIASGGYRRALLEVAMADGDRAEYEALLETFLRDLPGHPIALVQAALLAIDDGRIDDARAYADRLDSTDHGGRFVEALRPAVRAKIEFAQTGHPASIERWLTSPLIDYVDGHVLMEGASELIASGLGSQLLAALQPDGVARCADPAVDGLVAELGGEHDAAESLYRDALESPERCPVTILAEIDLGRARLASARGDDPTPHFAAAADRLRAWPGTLRNRVEALAGAPRPARDDPRALTPREREVALLVTEGRTNGGIAEELFISTKTASVHVSNILSKLGMSSRTEVAAWVASGGLAEAS